MAHQEQPLFFDIERGDLEAVQQRVLADAAVLEERTSNHRGTPLMCAIARKKPAIALWIIEHRGQHDFEAANDKGWTALHYASQFGPLEVVQTLVAAGANPAALTGRGCTPLMGVCFHGHPDIVVFLLQLSIITPSIDAITQHQATALSCASYNGHQPIVQLLLDAGADPTLPAGPNTPVNCAVSNNHHAIASLLCHVISETDRPRTLHKARSLLNAGAAALACLQGRVEQGQALPLVELITPQQQQGNDDGEQEKLRATAAFAVGIAGGEKDTGLCEELYLELLMYMLPAWADKGPAGV